MGSLLGARFWASGAGLLAYSRNRRLLLALGRKNLERIAYVAKRLQ